MASGGAQCDLLGLGFGSTPLGSAQKLPAPAGKRRVPATPVRISMSFWGEFERLFLWIFWIYVLYILYIYICILYIYAVGHSRIYFFGAPRWMPDRSRLYRSRTNIPLNMPTWAWAEQLHAPAQCLKARSRLCRFRTNTPLKHTNMSVSSTAAPSPLNTWQPDHVYAAF